MLVRKNPCFDAARLLMLKNLYLLHDIEFGKEMRSAALYLKNRWVLFDLMREYGNIDEAVNVPDNEEQDISIDRTMNLIDAFLETLPPEKLSLEAEGAAAVDYVSTYLVDDNVSIDVPKMRGQELIDSFLESGDEKFTLQLLPESSETSGAKNNISVPEISEIASETPIFTETLANIYLKQGKYEKALEILKRLYLDYPNKNRYFADQIRFLEKIVKHTKRK
jgi:tetratricopeptide (TPR) repeat protein